MLDYDRIWPLQTTKLIWRTNNGQTKAVCKCGKSWLSALLWLFPGLIGTRVAVLVESANIKIEHWSTLLVNICGNTYTFRLKQFLQKATVILYENSYGTVVRWPNPTISNSLFIIKPYKNGALFIRGAKKLTFFNLEQNILAMAGTISQGKCGVLLTCIGKIKIYGIDTWNFCKVNSTFAHFIFFLRIRPLWTRKGLHGGHRSWGRC